MSDAQVSSHYTHIPYPDPLSLEGLDDFLCGLIDEVFQVEPEGVTAPVDTEKELAEIEADIFADIESLRPGDDEEFETIVDGSPGIFYKSGRSATDLDERPSLFLGDDDGVSTLTLRAKLLESQLDYRNKELKESLRRMRWLESELASREDQIKFIPELLKRSIDATRYEFELDDLKLKLEFLSSELSAANAQLDSLRCNWLGKLSLWLASKKEKTHNLDCQSEASD